ncbi:stress-response A/B barrel domain-containing protein isoform X1 [Senna tora]|uniref:Stress-response A/B barrel domain-containing protein isoform X1 n=1 Tax=Senna tora TaxID=362788 RepID=A0A834W8U8_9FABA|nr:stress-response A/B barrel domain-containing protein isoform X1 [Senna tora]
MAVIKNVNFYFNVILQWPFAIRHLLIWNSSCSGHSPSPALHADTFLSTRFLRPSHADACMMSRLVSLLLQINLIHLFSSTAQAQAEAGEEYAHLQRIHHQEQEKRPYYECLVVYDAQNIKKRFHPKRLNCSNYMWVHRNYGGYKMGTRICLASQICVRSVRSLMATVGQG